MTDQPAARTPAIIGWEITNQCNLACPHCFTAAGKKAHNELTTDECRRLVDAMAGIGVRMIGWTGGEPLLRPDLEELTRYAWDKGIKCNITTNGVLLDDARAASVIDAGIRTLQISLDGSTPERNHVMRRTTEEEFHRIIAGIRACRKRGARIFLASLLGEENLDDAPEMIKLACREEADAIRFCAYTPVGRGKHQSVKDRLLFTHRLAELFQFVDQVQAEGKIAVQFDVGFGPVPPEWTFHKCIAGMETFYLKANGDVYPCTALVEKRFVIGNVRQESLAEIWRKPEMTAMANFPRERIHGPCRTCDNFAACRGACRGTALFHLGDLFASFPTCLYNQAGTI